MEFEDIPNRHFIRNLTFLLNGLAVIDEHGRVIHTRELVERKPRWKAYVYSEDNHRLPHFHVKSSDGRECSFDLSGGILAGKLGSKECKTVREWLSLEQGVEEVRRVWLDLNKANNRQNE